MGKINAVRLININYNNNSIRINDEVMHLNGESTLISLQNGGGKTVLVQMLTAPFVHKRYRNTADRPFEGFFTSAKPSFILVEWSLDGGAGYMMNGLMIRRNQNESEEQQEALEITGIISAYREPCSWDLHHLPVVEKTKKEMTLKGYAACRQLFEGYKKDRDAEFFYYDMNHSAQQRQYFEKLREYRVDYREWEDIVRKINQKEGGLTELFADCRDERSLTEKWFLESIEKKLDKDGSRIREFERIVGNYVRQYYENEDKIKRRDTIRQFKELVLEGGEAVPVREQAVLVMEQETERQVQESRIAAFRGKMLALHADLEAELARREQEMEMLRKELLHLRHEKFSWELIQLSEEKRAHEAEYERLAGILQELSDKLDRQRLQLGILRLRKSYDAYGREKREYDEVYEKLRVARKKGTDLAPRREELGRILCAYYGEQLEKLQEEMSACREELSRIQEEIRALSESRKEVNAKIRKAVGERQELKLRIEGFSEKESAYNTQFQGMLARNILGRYEEGQLEIEEERQRSQWQRTEKELKQSREKKAWKDSALEKYERDLHAAGLKRVKLAAEREKWEMELARLDAELAARRPILQYAGLLEDSLFDTERIEKELEARCEELTVKLSFKQEEYRQEQREYEALSQGKIYELPEPVAQELQSLGISGVFGLEWMRKNGKSLEENAALVERNPFLPYALIVTPAEYRSMQAMESYTSMPVPVILRADLEKGEMRLHGGFLELDKLNVYLRFNRNLLDEEKLLKLLEEKEQVLSRLKEQIRIRQKEITDYRDRLGTLRSQTVTAALYGQTKDAIGQSAKADEALAGHIKELERDAALCREQLLALDTAISGQEASMQEQEKRRESFRALAAAYEVCLEQMRQLAGTEALLEQLQQEEAHLEEEQEHGRQSVIDLTRQQEQKNQAYRNMEEQGRKYDLYRKEAERLALSEEDYRRIDRYASEYRAITDTIDADVRRLEEILEKQTERLSDARKEYERQKKRLSKDTGREPESLEQRVKVCIYSEDEELAAATHEKELEEQRRKREKEQSAADKQISLKQQRMEIKTAEMAKECGMEKPLPPSEVVPKDYEALIRTQEFKGQELGNAKRMLEQKRQEFSALLSGLAEYAEFQVLHEVEFKEDLSLMNKEELDRAKGLLIRDYNGMKEEIRRLKNRMEGRIRDILAMEEFQNPYYKKPLEAMLSLVELPSELVRQIDTTIKAYEDLMKKIEVDLSLVEKERANIIGELLEYVKAVHQDLDKLDANSTITVRDRTLKMLDIQIPDWLENEELYQLRMRDFVDQLTLQGVEFYRENRNVSEYFGTQLNTKTLYDTVVGLSQVHIKLYKIEERREVPITWSEVAKNSGGEGFLSTFVILSSLLHYIRRDETDLFAERNESKVLIMDNPFGVTYSEHLLKPLMELAAKNNTQLVCLSGLGGDSIYGRFNNIYILNRVMANLRNGQQFLRMEHYRGAEPEVITTSRFEVAEQLTLF